MSTASYAKTIIKLAMIATVIVISAAVPLHAAAQKGPTEAQKEFASFIDGFIAGVRNEWNVPGMSFIAVRDGEILYKRGYGHTTLDGSEPVSADATAYRIGDISMIFTASAVLQLAEKGRVLLDDDVNNYLRKNKLPEKFDAPITIRHLLTHTSGLDWKELETCVATADDERAFANKISRIMPSRYLPPGESYCVSRMGYAILGSIIERYSRQGLASAMRRHIFSPLGMHCSSFAPDEEQMKSLAAGYSQDGSRMPFSYRADAAASSMISTASDMGRFMLAILDGGRLGRVRILSPSFAGGLLRTNFTPSPHIDGAALGCVERMVGGVRTIQATGDIDGHTTFMMLIPDKNFGLFFAANVSGLGSGRDLASAVISRFFAGPSPAAPEAAPGSIPNSIAGSYRTNMIAHGTAEKAMAMFADQIKITLDGDAAIVTHSDGNSAPERWRSAGKGLLRLVDDYGRPTDRYISYGGSTSPPMIVIGEVGRTYEKLDGIDERSVQHALFALFIAVCAVSLIGLYASITFNARKMPWEKGCRGSTEIWTLSSMFCAIQASFVIGLVLFYKLFGDEFAIFVPYKVKALFVIPLAGSLLLAWLWFRLLMNMIDPEHHWCEKILLAAVAASETVYMIFLFHWRLLGFLF